MDLFLFSTRPAATTNQFLTADAALVIAGNARRQSSAGSTGRVSRKQSKDLIDPNDPLTSTEELIDNAIEVLNEIRSRTLDAEGRIVFVNDADDPEWLGASLEYVGTVLEAVRERGEER